FAAAVLVTVPFLRGVVGLDRERAIARRLSLAAGEEAGRSRFAADTLEIGKGNSVVIRRLLQRDLWHQFIDIHECFFFRHGQGWKKNGADATLRATPMATTL